MRFSLSVWCFCGVWVVISEVGGTLTWQIEAWWLRMIHSLRYSGDHCSVDLLCTENSKGVWGHNPNRLHIPIDSMNKYYSKYTLQTRLLQLLKQAKFVICVYNHQMCFWYLFWNIFFSSLNWSRISSKQKILAKNWQSENILEHYFKQPFLNSC